MSVSQQFLIRIKCSLDQSTLLNSPQLKITITMLIHFCKKNKKTKTKQKQNKSHLFFQLPNFNEETLQ